MIIIAFLALILGNLTYIHSVDKNKIVLTDLKKMSVKLFFKNVLFFT